jgi:predicted short-subunit dehydrogenase-like oxidoreductase (DUF2520 family)
LRGLKVAVLGVGRAGSAFASALSKRGARVRTWSRRSSRPLAAAVADADLVLLCVRDDAIATVAQRLAAEVPFRARTAPVALHLSGFHGSRPLRALARKGWPTGSMHPLVPLTGRASAAHLEGAWFATSARGRASAMAKRLIGGLRGSEFKLPGGDRGKPAWHLSCAFVANGAVALFDAGLVHAGAKAGPALASLLEKTARSLQRGTQAALSGPVARGENEVVAGHLALLRGRAEEARLYRLLSRRLLALSALSASKRQTISRLLR